MSAAVSEIKTPMNKPAVRILALLDSLTLATGFARVGQNLIPHWVAAGASVDVWGIGFNGWGYQDWPQVKILPAGGGGPWNTPKALEEFLGQLAQGNYTHVFILQDHFNFNHQFCQAFQHVCTQKRIRSLMYFPVDAPMEPEWTAILASVDVAVAYTQYGKTEVEKQAAKAECRINCQILPHGVDTSIYRPLPAERDKNRRMWAVGPKDRSIIFCRPDDFLMLNVNTNQWRKDAPRSLEIHAELLRRGVPAKLIMHCRKSTPYGTDLEGVGRQLGLQLHRDWIHTSDLFGAGDSTYMGRDEKGRDLIGSLVSQENLALFYNAADLVLSTSLGEGWGFSISEALATGCPVAAPHHTSCAEIYQTIRKLDSAYAIKQMVMLPADDLIVMPGEVSRLRHRVQMPHAADAIEAYYKSNLWRERPELPDVAKEWMNWKRIAIEMLKLLVGTELANEMFFPTPPVTETTTPTLTVTV